MNATPFLARTAGSARMAWGILRASACRATWVLHSHSTPCFHFLPDGGIDYLAVGVIKAESCDCDYSSGMMVLLAGWCAQLYSVMGSNDDPEEPNSRWLPPAVLCVCPISPMLCTQSAFTVNSGDKQTLKAAVQRPVCCLSLRKINEDGSETFLLSSLVSVLKECVCVWVCICTLVSVLKGMCVWVSFYSLWCQY